MIDRYHKTVIEKALSREAAVAILGPRQIGKTTLARQIADERPSVYLDLEDNEDRARLADPKTFFNAVKGKLVVMDEIHQMPEIFKQLRGIIDQGRREGLQTGRFLILGSATMDLLKQSETLAGRIAYIDMGPLGVADQPTGADVDQLWVRGGYPRSLTAFDDEISLEIRRSLVRSYLVQDVPMFAPRLPVETIERLWRMLAHHHGGLLNVSQLAGSLGAKGPAVNRYIGLLCDLLLVRRLEPHFVNTSKRLIKTPKTYIRDSGLLHALMGIETLHDILGHPIAGESWEGFVIENLLAVVPPWTAKSFYRTRAGAEIDLVLEFGGTIGTWAIEIKRSRAPSLDKAFYNALEDVQPAKSFVVYAGEQRYPKAEGIDVISLPELVSEIQLLKS